MIKNNIRNINEKLIPTTVRLEEPAYNKFKELAKESGSTLGEILRHTLEFSLDKYLKRVGYSDNEKTAELLSAVRELCDICGGIYNEIHRIGINYNQELRLKNAEAKRDAVLGKGYMSVSQKMQAIDEYENETAEIKKTCLEPDVLQDILTRFENAVEKARSFIWLH
ncbi:MAG: hypothetical protein NC253_01180 [Ruminococcus sp.]|nr:hypothetical protein [Ruminococcus sp.]MCM1382320.1 hypothetical protein [Muribaculaceae bacterium]MCM1480488.1 hypothetical protein [Muribaculaceae bacterium]